MPDTANRPASPGVESLSVFFPCYNEQDNLRRVYESAAKVLGNQGLDYEIILVDDGSADQTPRIADTLATADPRVKVVHHPTNLGYGAAIQSGIRAATKTLVFFTDGDGQFDLNELPPLLPLMKEFDIVSCFRLDRQEGLIRKLNSWCWTRLVCLLFRLKLKDINCAFKLFKHRVFDGMELQSAGALINAEILARATRRRYAIFQVGVHHFPRLRGRPTGANLRVIFRAFRELVKLYRQINR
jgi:glycosyltransferase involved in cell wall biosynthesis